MKTDRKLLVAVLLLIGLVIWLLVISIQRSHEVQQAVEQINHLQSQINSLPKPVTPKDGYTPIKNVDYFDGKNSVSTNTVVEHQIIQQAPGKDGESAYQSALKLGFVGTEIQWLESLKVKGDKGDTAPTLDIYCQDGHIFKKYSNNTFPQITNIKCEVVGNE